MFETIRKRFEQKIEDGKRKFRFYLHNEQVHHPDFPFDVYIGKEENRLFVLETTMGIIKQRLEQGQDVSLCVKKCRECVKLLDAFLEPEERDNLDKLFGDLETNDPLLTQNLLAQISLL